LTNIRKSLQATVKDVPDKGSEHGVGFDDKGKDNEAISNQADTGRQCAPRNLRTLYRSRAPKPTQLAFYPSQWHDLIEDGKLCFCMTASIKKGFPKRQVALIEAGDCPTGVMAVHANGGGTVETGMIF
jgi:hypothetical protein